MRPLIEGLLMTRKIRVSIFLSCLLGLVIIGSVELSRKRENERIKQPEMAVQEESVIKAKIETRDENRWRVEREKAPPLLQDTKDFFRDFFVKKETINKGPVESEENNHVLISSVISNVDACQIFHFNIGSRQTFFYNPKTKKMLIRGGIFNAIKGDVDRHSIRMMKMAIDMEILKEKYYGYSWQIASSKLDFDNVLKEISNQKQNTFCILREIEIADKGYAFNIYGARVEVASGSFSYYSFEITNNTESLWKCLSGLELTVDPSEARTFIPNARIIVGVSPLGYQQSEIHVVGEFEPTVDFPYALKVLDYRIQSVLKEIIVFDNDKGKVILKEDFL
jgi:hypothetical protein